MSELRPAFDARVVPEAVLAFARACQKRVSCALGGGAALAGAWLHHRTSKDIDLFLADAAEHRTLVSELSAIATSLGGAVVLQRDSGTHVRALLEIENARCEVDVVVDTTTSLEPLLEIDRVQTLSLADLRANKITCLLSRMEPRDLVDVMFLDRHGFPPEADLASALKKDAGIDPAILAWLLSRFRTTPLPEMLKPLSASELDDYRVSLAERIRALV